MTKELLEELGPYRKLYRDSKSGIAWVEDGTAGVGHSCHANIDASGSVEGMKALHYWNETDRTVRSHGFIYNIDTLVMSDEDDRRAANFCRCGGRCKDYQSSALAK